jgi:hypothetical protein
LSLSLPNAPLSILNTYSLSFSKEGRSAVGRNFVKEVVLPSMSNLGHFYPKGCCSRGKKSEAVRNRTHDLNIGHGNRRRQPVRWVKVVEVKRLDVLGGLNLSEVLHGREKIAPN